MKKMIFVLILFLTGCTKYTDLADLTIIKTIGIDYSNESYTTYAQIIDDIEDNQPVMKTIEEKGKTIKESFNNLKERINKEISLSHIDLLVLSDNLKQNNYQDIINYFVNNNEFRNDFYCVFSLDISNLLNNSEYDEVEMFLKTKEEMLMKNFDDVILEFLDNKKVTLPNITYQDEITYLGNDTYTIKENNYAKEN